MATVIRQFQQHSVALVSLAIAISSLGYNTWRNEQTEANRNVRSAGIQLLLKLGDLEQVVFFSHYDRDEIRGSLRAGWSHVLTIQDLAALAGGEIPRLAAELKSSWESDSPRLRTDDDSRRRIDTSIDALREALIEVLAGLD